MQVGSLNRTSVDFKTSFHPVSYWTSSDGSVFSEHTQDILLFYASAYWVGGLSMPPDGFSVHMPIMFVNSKFSDDK